MKHLNSLNAAAFAAALLAAPTLWAATAPTALGLAPTTSVAADDDEDEKEDEWHLVAGGDVYTGTGAVLRGASILIKNGLIHEIGYDLFVPEGAGETDVSGYRVYPGLIALGATSRVTTGRFAAEDPTWAIDPLSDPDEWMTSFEDEDLDLPTVDQDGFKSRYIDSYDPFSPYMTLALANGITACEQSGAAFKLRRDGIEGVVMNEDTSTNFNMRGGSARQRTRDGFAGAAKYLRDMATWERRGKPKDDEPSTRGVDTNSLRVLRNELDATFFADDRLTLLAIARLAQDYGFRPIVQGCREGWIVADELGRAGALVVLDPRERSWNDPESLYESGSSIENAAILHRSGCQIAVRTPSASIDTSGIAGRDLLSLSLQAGYAIRGGLDEEVALAAITLVPARVLGIDHRVGSIEVGKDADLLVTRGDILHYETLVDLAFVMGKIAYDKNKELYYAHLQPHQIAADLEADAAAESEDGSEADDADGDTDGDADESGDDD
ncbi:hypothetical protein Pla163_01590 [Planctomycetes bacterium Pla163]|uniref:Amidohydrolase-related domain-containing protein n=1 Tax=Rohdeia mirabilis TaxID=2528008 RepID=A0A518CV09_9BACT|nr:hypothetical protein Pla163_01590 [Planctomycetes bacterium Pla163]